MKFFITTLGMLVFYCATAQNKVTLIEYKYEIQFQEKDINTGMRGSTYHTVKKSLFLFTVDGDTTIPATGMSIGYTGQYLRPYIASSPEAIQKLNAFKTRRIARTTLKVLAIGGFVTSAFSLRKFMNQEGTRGFPYEFTAYGLTTLGIYIASELIHLGKNVEKAVDLYNNSIIAESRRKSNYSSFGLMNYRNQKSSALGLNWAYHF